MIWFKYGYHDYMDEKPGYGFQLFKSEEHAKAWVEGMNRNYSGGTTWIIGPATKAEVLSYVERYKIELDDLTKQNINNDAYYYGFTCS